jgi:hypothetical protein
MKKVRLGLGIPAAVLLAAASLWAQASRPASPVPTRPTTNPTTPGKQEPCWKQVGISQSALQQRRQIAQQTHSQIEAVCANASLTEQQKEQQIHQIREQAHAKMNSLVSPSQIEALKSCRAKRGMGGASPSPAARGAGPCGEMPLAGKGKAQPGASPQKDPHPEEEP